MSRRSLRFQGDRVLPQQEYYNFTERNGYKIFKFCIEHPGQIVTFCCYVTVGSGKKKTKVGHNLGLQYIPDHNRMIWWESNAGPIKKSYGDYYKFYISLRSQAEQRGINFDMSASAYPEEHARLVELAMNRYMGGVSAEQGYCAGYIQALFNNGYEILSVK
jgi:hypothetical protein